MSFNVNELDNRVEEFLSSGLREAEERRRIKAAMPAGERYSAARRLGLAATWVGRTADAVWRLAIGIQNRIAGSPRPGEECC